MSVFPIVNRAILRPAKFAENEVNIIPKFKDKTWHAKDRLYQTSH